MIDLLLYHWSPTRRREGIRLHGIRVGVLSTDRLWRPPFSCWADSPSLAWGLSGMMPRAKDEPSWDLWMLWSDRLHGYEALPFDAENGGPERIKEYRVYYDIPSEDLWLVGTRTPEHDE